jgi:hypothetical protein
MSTQSQRGRQPLPGRTADPGPVPLCDIAGRCGFPAADAERHHRGGRAYRLFGKCERFSQPVGQRLCVGDQNDDRARGHGHGGLHHHLAAAGGAVGAAVRAEGVRARNIINLAHIEPPFRRDQARVGGCRTAKNSGESGSLAWRERQRAETAESGCVNQILPRR